jgi:predicted GNAT family acetyltransferase
MVRKSGRQVRLAIAEDLIQVAEAQAVIAFMECGVDPMTKDRDGFLKRVMRRIEQGRVFVAFEDGRLVFKADVIADTSVTAYLEGVYVAPEHRGKGIGSDCLAEVTLRLLDRVENVCLLSNVEFADAHKTYFQAGFRPSDECTTLFV